MIVALELAGDAAELTALGRQIAMHVASSKPQAIDPSGLDPAVVAREKDVLADKFRQQGKPDNVIAKIVESGLKTYYKEVCLLEQPFIFDDKKTVAQAIKEAEGKVGSAVPGHRSSTLPSVRASTSGKRLRGRGRGGCRPELTICVAVARDGPILRSSWGIAWLSRPIDASSSSSRAKP